MKIISSAINLISTKLSTKQVYIPVLQKTAKLIPIILQKDQAFSSKIKALKGGWHGTTKEKLKDQLQKQEFENRNERIYFDTMETAIMYAYRKANGKETPIAVKIYGPKAQINDPMGKRGFYQYYEGKAEIIKAYEIRF